MCRVLDKNCVVTQKFKGANHKGIDLVGEGHSFANIVAHSSGEVVAVVKNIDYNTSKTGKKIYGNYVKIRHDNGMYTLYAHMKYGTVNVNAGDRVEQGKIIGYMGNTGYSFGGHLHFEVRNEEDKYIDPTEYVENDLPVKEIVVEVPVETTEDIEDIETLAKDVIAGKYGNGEERKNKLGDKYAEVQKRVNEILNGNQNLDTIEEIARQVIKGIYGNGEERRKKLEELGYNYEKVQKRVNEILK